MAWAKEALLALPRVALLIPKLAADDRVPLRIKLALGGLAVYLASPWDIIPDFIPVLGQLDDGVAILLFVDGVLNQVDDAILLAHWRGEVATLRRLQRLARPGVRWGARRVEGWVPGRREGQFFVRAVEAGQRRLSERSGDPEPAEGRSDGTDL